MQLFLVITDTTNLVTDLRVEGGLLENLACGTAWPPVGRLFDRSLSGILHNRFTRGSAVHTLNFSQLFPFLPVRMRRNEAVRGIGAEDAADQRDASSGEEQSSDRDESALAASRPVVGLPTVVVNPWIFRVDRR